MFLIDFIQGDVEVSVVIPLNYIERFYRHPEVTPKKIAGLWWNLMKATGYVISGFTVFLTAFVRFLGRPAEPFIYFIFGLGALFLIMAVIIVLVEWSESNSNSVDNVLIEKVLNASFCSEGVSVERSLGSERFIFELSVAEINSVSGYVQDGWLWVRDRGVVIETNDGEQYRLVLSFKNAELTCFLNDFVSSLSEINIPVKKVRKFQV